MIIYVGKDYQDVSRKAANIMSAQIIMKPNAVLGLATGSTPVGLYKQLIEWYNKGDLDFSQITSVNLDEYKGLSGDNDQSYRYFMNTNLFDHVNIDKNKTYVPNGLEEDSDNSDFVVFLSPESRWLVYMDPEYSKVTMVRQIVSSLDNELLFRSRDNRTLEL